MLNPKVGLFFLAVVPQFLPAGGSVVQAATVVGVVRRPDVQRRIEAWSGSLLAMLGIGTAVEAVAAKT